MRWVVVLMAVISHGRWALGDGCWAVVVLAMVMIMVMELAAICVGHGECDCDCDGEFGHGRRCDTSDDVERMRMTNMVHDG